jgi:glycosyltransferase involved in cell wall biosynthesis
MTRRIIIHQFDPEALRPGGVDTCISDLIAYAPDNVTFEIVGANSTGEGLGEWREVDHRGRLVNFMPVAQLWRTSRRRVPDSAVLARGLLRWRRRVPRALIQVHRLDVAAAALGTLRPAEYIQFIHNPHGAGGGVVGPGSDSFWRHAPSAYHWLEPRVLTRARHIVAFSRAEAERLRGQGFPAQAWRTWFDPNVFFPQAKPASSRLRISCIGRLEQQKDPVLALQALAELTRRGIDVDARFMGSGSLRPNLERRAAALGLTNSVRFLSAGSRPDVARLLHDTDVLILTSWYEGSPRVLIESLATGTPVAAVAEADPDQLVKDSFTGVRARDRSPQAVADAIVEAARVPPHHCSEAVADLRADCAVPALVAATELRMA